VNTSFFPDLSVQVTRRRSRCVLDPNLALSRDGAMLARLLAPYAELWVGGPEIFNILDSGHVYRREPELLIWPSTDASDMAAVPEVLRDWMQLREKAARSPHFHWVGDALRESFLPEDLDEAILTRWEAASRTLDLRMPKVIEATGPLIAAMRDAAALCAVLHSACILGRGTSGKPPLICRHLQKWGLAGSQLSLDDELVRAERAGFRQMLVEAGIAPFIWGGLRLAVVHLFLPRAGRLDSEPGSGSEDEPAAFSDEMEPALPSNPWEDAQCFWYDVTEPVR
jgi:hypothetical protein